MPRKANSRALNREAVVQAAAALIDTIGIEQVTLVDLAERLEIRTPSLYNHVQGMEGLRRELALFGVRELMKRVGQAIMGKAGDEAVLPLPIPIEHSSKSIQACIRLRYEPLPLMISSYRRRHRSC